MGVDEALLESARRSPYPATLRLYAWQPACLSLGFGQPYADLEMRALRENGWDVVRRITGGRAILHTDELTYAVVGGLDERLLQGGIRQSYLRISQALMAALDRLGLQAQSVENPTGPGNGEVSAVCYEAPGAFEITVGGKKLIGSAQARRSSGVLQHGSLPLGGDITRIIRVLRYQDEQERASAAERLERRATTLQTAIGHPVSWDEAAGAFVSAFEDALDVGFEETTLSRAEMRRAEELAETKYRQASWMERI
jgi:lipoate-protein ligase A